MDDKHACGGSCGCGGPQTQSDPYAESIQAVWHDPTGYDLAKHGPPYLKLSSDQRRLVQTLAFRASKLTYLLSHPLSTTASPSAVYDRR